MQVSFGKKIPISTNQVIEKSTNKPVNATFYEIDCEDEEDIGYLTNFNGDWRYKFYVISDMQSKYDKLHDENSSPIRKYAAQHNKFYTLETDDNKLLGICETQGSGDYANVHYLESEPEHKYKYAGKTILANIAKELSKVPDSELMVCDPIDTARTFYSDTCGFKEKDSHAFTMSQTDMKNFVDKYEAQAGKEINLVA